MDDRMWHYIKPNHSNRIPRRHIFMDTESASVRTKKGHVQRWRCGAAAYRQADKGRTAKDYLRVYRDPRALWTDVSEFTKPRHRTILWTHNLGYDVRIADAFRTLPALGWRVVTHNLANRGTWIQWARDGATLLMVDSTSVFPVSLERLATTHMLGKLPLPDPDGTEEEWMARCVSDVEILRTAVVAYLEWLESEDLGNWQMTGAGQSYAAFRHKHLTHRMLVHADPDALEAERRAMWAGRCEAYWRGRTGNVGVEEWDLALAYARVARDSLIPVRLLGPVGIGSDLRTLLARPRSAVLARVAVETDTPILPSLVDGRIAWPVGRFTTTVWGPELALALESGARLTVLGAWLYQAEPALRQWAQWIIDRLENPHAGTTAWQALVLKHWSRALIGRFGMNYTRWERYGVTEDLTIRHSTVYDTRTEEIYALSHLGRDLQKSVGTTEWDQSQPAITGYVMSACRAWLWRLISALPPRSVIYADTDSFYITGEHHDAAFALSRTALGDGLRLKTSHARATILGPRQIITDGRPRIAGVPRNAVLYTRGRLKGETWQSLGATLRHGDPSTVVTTDREWTVNGVDHRRTPTPSGWTEPIHMEGGE